MTDYVVGFMREALSDRVLLVRKNRPAWQAGLLNGPGGKIERLADQSPLGLKHQLSRMETPIEAMRREWKEEVGQDTAPGDWRLVASLTDVRDFYAGGGTVYWFASDVRFLPRHAGRTDLKHDSGKVPEELESVPLWQIPQRRDVVATVRWIVPLAFEDPTAPVVASVRA